MPCDLGRVCIGQLKEDILGQTYHSYAFLEIRSKKGEGKRGIEATVAVVVIYLSYAGECESKVNYLSTNC